MNHPREPFQRLFDRFNEVFAKIATREGFVFDPRSGPNISRSMRMECGRMQKGVFLEIRDHWMQSDPVDPQVTLSYGVWFYPAGHQYPLHLLLKTLYSGGINGLQDIEEKLSLAASEVKQIDEDVVIREGRCIRSSQDWEEND